MNSDAPQRPGGKPNLRLLKNEIEHARGASLDGTEDERGGGGGGEPPANGGNPPGEIWPNCPVKALGVSGDTFFYLDWLGQLCPVANHTKDRMRGIFGGHSEFLIKHFPQKDKRGKVSGWTQETAATAMMKAASSKGVWNAFERVRGLGAWPDPNGGVALHCGDAILYEGAWRGPGELDGFVYPSAPPIPRPLAARDQRAGDEDPGGEIVRLFSTWNWIREDLDAYLLMGWIGAAMFGGALDWRPTVWITGDKATGKSTIQKVLRFILGGEGASLQSTDATEASVRQFLMQSTVPVLLDELEAEADNRRAHAVIKLARQAASGGVVLRGGADHKGVEFRARSAFLFSSILVPPLLDQDISRIAMLELRPLPHGETPPRIDPKHWRRVGQALRGRILAQWERLAPTLELYRCALSLAGHDSRGCDQYGTLLAMAHLATSDAAPTHDDCDLWARRLSVDAITDQTDMTADWQKMLNHLLGQPLDIFRSGDRLTVGRWIKAAVGLADDPDQSKALRALPSNGIRIKGRTESAWIILANAHPQLSQLFTNTHWHAGGGQRGTWSQAAKRIPKAKALGALGFDGVSSRAYAFPLRSIPNFFGDDANADAAAGDDHEPETAPDGRFDPETFA